MAREYWTELDGTNGLYDISNLGNIRNVRTRHNVMPRKKTNSNSVIVSIKNKKIGKELKVHVGHAVYKHFTDKEFVHNGFKVIHIDGNHNNNNINNLKVLEHIHNKATKEQLEIFEKWVYRTVRKLVYGKYKSLKGFDFENLIQESVMLVYKYLPNYNIETKFINFCCHYVQMAFKNLIRQFRQFCLIEEKYLETF